MKIMGRYQLRNINGRMVKVMLQSFYKATTIAILGAVNLKESIGFGLE